MIWTWVDPLARRCDVGQDESIYMIVQPSTGPSVGVVFLTLLEGMLNVVCELGLGKVL